MTLRFTILGCGSSMGVPRPALGWGACDPNNPKNRRRRTSLLVERRGSKGQTRVLIDTSPDLREQLLPRHSAPPLVRRLERNDRLKHRQRRGIGGRVSLAGFAEHGHGFGNLF